MSAGKTVLITGASFGIGLEMARLFARDQYRLILVARTADRLAQAAEELKGLGASSALALVQDLSRTGAAEAIFQSLADQNLHLDVLVNNAGFGDYGPYAEAHWPAVESMVQVNITSLLHLTRLFLPGMIARKQGRIVNLASTAAFQPGPFMAVYYASKAFVLSFSEALSEECKGTGVTVTAVCPGPTATEFQARANVLNTGIARHQKSFLKMMDAATVAEIGYRGMLKGKSVVVTGVVNRVGAWSGRHLPRAGVMKAIKWAHKKR